MIPNPDVIDLYNLSIGVIAAVGVVYLVYLQRISAVFDRFLYYLLAGFFVFGFGGPIACFIIPEWAHVVHGMAALFGVFALYSPVHNDLRRDDWARLIFREPRMARHPEEWMTPMDDDILELFPSKELVMTPAIVADNLDYSRGEVNRHLSRLAEHGLLERVDRGKYRLTDRGDTYLRGT